MYICIITLICSSPLFFFILPCPLCGFNQFKNSIFVLI
jgi:hypothetical protein